MISILDEKNLELFKSLNPLIQAQLSTNTLEELLYNSVLDNNLENVKCFIKLGANVNKVYQYNITLLMIATYKGYKDIIIELLDSNIDINETNIEGQTSLFLALDRAKDNASINNLDICELILSKNPKDDTSIIFNIAQLFYDNNRKKQAAKLYKKCANDGHAVAAFNLALMYEEGVFIEKNIKKATILFKIACANDYTNAYYSLGHIYYTQFYKELYGHDEVKLIEAAKKAIFCLKKYNNLISLIDLNVLEILRELDEDLYYRDNQIKDSISIYEIENIKFDKIYQNIIKFDDWNEDFEELRNDLKEKTEDTYINASVDENISKEEKELLNIELTPSYYLNVDKEVETRQKLFCQEFEKPVLEIEHDKDNQYDDLALKILCNNTKIGYVLKYKEKEKINKFCFTNYKLNNLCVLFEDNTIKICLDNNNLDTDTSITRDIEDGLYMNDSDKWW